MENTIYDLFKCISDKHKDCPAIIENNSVMTFAELSDMVDMLAELIPNNVNIVGIMMNHSAKMIASIFATLKNGLTYIPVEPNFPIERIKYMMGESNADIILTETQFSEKLSGFQLLCVDALRVMHSDETNNKIYEQNPNNTAYILYTSGSTGRPKGVAVSNNNVCHYVRAFDNEFHLGYNDVMLQYSVCTFDIFVEEVFASLLNGVPLAIPTKQDKVNIQALMKFVKLHKVTIISGFPYLLAEMNCLPEIPSSVRLLISGGDVLRGNYIDRLINKVEIYNTYGPSETTVCASYHHCRVGDLLGDGTYSIGKAVLGTIIKILDENGEEVPKGEIGEICIYGDGVSKGYIGNRKEENKAFVKLSDGKMMYRSGDMGYLLSDGSIAFLYRKDNQIMIYGKRVEVMEVESILNQCVGVEKGIVRAYIDEEGLSYMIAYIIPADLNLQVSQVKRMLSKYLADYMIPEFIIKLSRLPLNSNGKIDISKLPVVMK